MREIERTQCIGDGFSAYGSELKVLLTYQDDKVQDLQVIKHHGSEMDKWALDELPSKAIAANSTGVDGTTGASATDRTIKEATKGALQQA